MIVPNPVVTGGSRTDPHDKIQEEVIMIASGKPTVEALGIDVRSLRWQRSGDTAGSIEVAFTEAGGDPWVLMRVVEDPASRVLVYDHHEWECFLDGAKRGEFDDATGHPGR
jgi:hypothetical protein